MRLSDPEALGPGLQPLQDAVIQFDAVAELIHPALEAAFSGKPDGGTAGTRRRGVCSIGQPASSPG